MSFNILYYPYAQIETAQTLKLAALYFDKISVINPWSVVASKGHHTDGAEIERSMSTISPSIVGNIDPNETVSEYDDIMTASIMQDVSDPQYVKLCQGAGQDYWRLAAVKTPSLDLDLTYRRMLVNLPNLAEQKLLSTRGRVRNREEYREIDHRYGEYGFLHGIRVIDLPFAIGESIMINHAICASDNHNLTPFTDETIHHRILLHKYERLANSQSLRRILKEYGYIEDVKAHMVATEVLKYQLKGYQNLDVESILDFRKSHKTDLRRLRIEMAKLSGKIEHEFWDPGIEREVRQLSNSDVAAALQEIGEAIESEKERLVVGSTVSATASISLGLSVMPFFSVPVGMAVAAGSFALDRYLERWHKKRTVSRNGYTYLFEAKKLVQT